MSITYGNWRARDADWYVDASKSNTQLSKSLLGHSCESQYKAYKYQSKERREYRAVRRLYTIATLKGASAAALGRCRGGDRKESKRGGDEDLGEHFCCLVSGSS